MTSRLPYSVHPTGWFHAYWADELAPGDVVPLHYFGEDLVLFRLASGEVSILDAYCPHQGAHLGYGGTVEDEVLVCPFHGWTWNARGENCFIPNSSRSQMKVKARRWPVVERNGVVYLWHDAAGGEPAWEVPEISQLASDEFYPVRPKHTRTWEEVPVHVQMIVENTVDIGHFESIHHARGAAAVLAMEPGEHTFRAQLEMTYGGKKGTTWLTPKGPEAGGADSTWYGLGFSVTSFDMGGSTGWVHVQAATPIDDEYSRLWAAIAVPRPPGADPAATEPEDAMLARMVTSSLNQTEKDFPIWKHMRYRERVPLTPEEKEPLLTIRAWAHGFYPGAEPAPVTPTTERT